MQTCLICLEEGTNVMAITHCGVYYVHTKCYSQWLLKNDTCIVCRKPLIEEPTNLPQATNENREIYIKFAIVNIIIVISILTLAILTVYIFVTCDLKSNYCKLF